MTRKEAPRSYSIAFGKQAAAAGVALDARGLLPLETARAVLASAQVVERNGDPSPDLLWACMLSLEDGDELARASSRLTWSFPHLRGWDVEDAVIRYGAGALPWLDRMLDLTGGAVGSAPPLPFYFVGTHLLAIGPEAARSVLRVKRDSDADPDGLGFAREWLGRHGKPAWTALGTLAVEGDTTARAVLETLARRSPSSVRRQLGKELAARALGSSVPTALDASAILTVLDAAASSVIGTRMPWPTLVARAGHFEYHAMRVVAVRAKKGDDWGVLVEVVQGDVIGDVEEVRWPATIQQYTYGSKVAIGGRYLHDARPIPASVAERQLDDATIAALDLRPGRSITGEVSDWPSVLALRAAVAVDPAALFPPGASVAKALGMRSAEVLLDVRALEHVAGTQYGRGDLARLPSASPSWRSIAEVIATRDPARFDPGAVNTDWRMHAVTGQATPSPS